MRLIQPHQHKLHYYTFFDDPGLFYSLINYWVRKSKKYGVDEIIGKTGKSSYRIKNQIIINDDIFDFKCKLGMTWRTMEDGTHKRNFEYEIKMRSPDKMKSFYISFSPQILKYTYGPSEEYGDYQPIKLKKKVEGVDVQLVSVNISYDDGQELLHNIFKNIQLDNFWRNQRIDLGKIRQNEFYIRYNSKYERKIGMILDDMNKVFGFTGNSYTKSTRDITDFKYDLFSLRCNRFSELGFETKNDEWRFAIKTYRAREYSNLEENNPLHHPKLEIYLDEEKKGRTYPELKDIKELQNTIYQIIANILDWANVSNEDGFIMDSYFDNKKFIDFDIIKAKNMYEDLSNYYRSTMPGIKKDCYKSNSMFDYYDCVIENGNVNYEVLCKSTGFGIDWIKKITYRLEDLKILRRIRSSKSLIQFHSNKVMEIAKAIIQSFRYENGFDGSQKQERKKKRIKSRKNRLTKIKERLTKKKIAKIEPTIIEEQFVKKSGVRLWSKIGLVKKVNGGLYRLQNIEYRGKKPKNYEKLLRDYG